MKDLFICLLNLLTHKGNITEAVMYQSHGGFARVDFEAESGKYSIAISRIEETESANNE